MSGIITKSNFEFLNDLRQNNNRDWFNENKAVYVKHHEDVAAFSEEVLGQMNKHDNIETLSGKKSLHRIYRDVRFSKDKTPYSPRWSGGYKRATKLLRGGYYFHIEPGNSFVAGGFWAPNKEDIHRIREELAYDDKRMRKIITAKTFKDHFGELLGEQLKTAPKGYPKDHAAIELLRYKQFLVKKDFSNKQVLSSSFSVEVNETYRAMRPFFDYMSEVLTTDKNGESIY